MASNLFVPILAVDSGCMSCGKFFGCKDENKGGGWVCNKYQSMNETHIDDLQEQAVIHVSHQSSVYQTFNDDPGEVSEFEDMILNSVSQTRLLPVDLAVDDSDFKEAKNYFEWTMGSNGIKFRPFSRQMWIALRLFAEVCPHCSDSNWYHNIEAVPVDYPTSQIQSHLTLLEHGVCPECGRGRAQMFLEGDLDIPQELSACIGQRGGKSIQIAGLISYHLHKLLKTIRPSEFYGLASSSTLTHTCTALQFKRAYALLWSPIRDTISDSPWFKGYHGMLKHHGDRLGQELVVIKDTFINWRRSRLLAAPSAPNVGTLRGDTRAGASIDELGFFRFGAGSEEYVTISADEIHTSLTNSLATVRNAASRMIRAGDNTAVQGLMFNISSPSSVFDKIMTLVRAAKNSRVMLGVHLPTWEMNPQITRQDLQIYWDTDAKKAERDFGANPPLAANPFFGDLEPVFASFGRVPNRVQYRLTTNPANNAERSARLGLLTPLSRMPPSLMTLDAGESNNSFSLAISIPMRKGKLTDRPKPNSQGFAKVPARPVPSKEISLNVDLGDHRSMTIAVIEIIPPKNGRINFNRVYENVIVPLLKPFNVAVCVTDRWNSILLLDRLHDEHGVATFQYSLRYADFVAIKSYVEGGMVSLPRTESEDPTGISTFDETQYPYCFESRPIDHLALQFQTVQDGVRTVSKGANLTDDSFRSVALAIHYLRNAEFVKLYLSGDALNSGRGGGLVASPGGNDQSVGAVVSLTGHSNKALVAVGSSSGDSGTTFARSKR